MYATKGVMTESVTSSDGSVTSRRRCANTHPAARPIAIPPAATATNCAPTPTTEPADPPTAAIAILYAVSAVPSLTSDSPSRIVLLRPVTPRRSSTAAALTGSVGPSTAPSTNAAAHGTPSTALATTATAAIVTRTRPTASSVIGAQFALNS